MQTFSKALKMLRFKGDMPRSSLLTFNTRKTQNKKVQS